MTPEQEKRGRWCNFDYFTVVVAIIWAIGIIFTVTFICRADTTKVWQAIEKPKPTVCEKVCPVCGGCIPVFIRRIERYSNIQATGMVFECVRGPRGCDTTKFIGGGCRFTVTDCDSIIWGRYRTICRVDTAWYAEGINAKNIDTIFTDDPRCAPVVRARGLDSVFVLGHDSTYQIGDREAMKKQNMTDLYILKDTTIFIRDPHWVYFNWLNGKRTKMRREK